MQDRGGVDQDDMVVRERDVAALGEGQEGAAAHDEPRAEDRGAAAG